MQHYVADDITDPAPVVIFVVIFGHLDAITVLSLSRDIAAKVYTLQ